MTSRNITFRHVLLLYHGMCFLSTVRNYSSIPTTCDELKIMLCSATCNITRLLPKSISDSYAYVFYTGQFDRTHCENCSATIFWLCATRSCGWVRYPD